MAAHKRFSHEIVVTRGSKGVLWYFFTDRIRQNQIEGRVDPKVRGDDFCLGRMALAAPKVNAADTVGAGDCFSGALAARLARQARRFEDTVDAVRFAVAAAAIKVTRHGAQAGMPYRREILKMLERMR